METTVDKNTCRICLRKQNTVYSLFRKRKGIFPCEKLDKIGVKSSINDTAPSNICCECLAELDITVSFLEKCEKANQILSEQLTRGLVIPEEIVTFKGNAGKETENNAYYDKNNDLEVDQEVNVDSTALEDEVKTSDVALSIEEPRCAECGSKRRCRHWTPPATHTCPYCQKVFSRKFNFKLHLKRHSGEREWSCAVCGARAVSRWLAARHCEPRRRRPCPVPGCGKTYTTNTNLNTHLRMHTGERPFECSNCGKKFTSKNTLNDHMRIHTGALPYICPVCGKRFRTNKLSAHMWTHGAARLACARGGCALRFASRRALQRHRAAQHAPAAQHATAAQHAPAAPAPPQHACALCPARYHHRQSLNKHVRKQHDQKSVSSEIVTNDFTKEIECDL